MSKTWVKYIFLMLCIAMITGCNLVTPIKKLSLVVHVAADSSDNYKAYGFLYDYQADQLLDDVQLTVGGTPSITHDRNNPVSIPDPGSTITITAKQDRIGTIERNDIKIPIQIPDLAINVDTPFDRWFNKADNLILQWTPFKNGTDVNADFYVVYVRAYVGTTEIGYNLAINNRQWTGADTDVTVTLAPSPTPVPSGSPTPTPTKKQMTTVTIYKSDRDSLLDFSRITSIKPTKYTIQVQGYKWIQISEISSDSVFEVGGIWSNPVEVNPPLTTPTPTP